MFTYSHDEYEAGKRTHLFIADSDRTCRRLAVGEVASDGPTLHVVPYNAGMDIHEKAGGVAGITTEIAKHGKN